MFVEFQYPIVDFRDLIKDNFKLPIPNWPMPEEEKMIKNNGIIRIRNKGGSTYWSGENLYCTARKGIQLSNFEKHRIEFSNQSFLTSECRFRRINSDGNFLVKCEIGFSNRFEEFFNKISITNNYFEQILSAYCNIDVLIGNHTDEKNEFKVFNCGKAITEQYLYSTSTKTGIKKNKIENWWIGSGKPLCIAVFEDENNSVVLPKHAILIKKYVDEKIELYHYRKKLTNQSTIQTWIIKILDKENCDHVFLRNLRLNLLRINAEKETLKGILTFLKQYENKFIQSDEYSSKLSIYLENVSSKLLKEVRYGIDQENFLDAALKAEEFAKPGELESYQMLLLPFENDYIDKNIEKIFSSGPIINVNKGGSIETINITENGGIKYERRN